MPPFMEVDKMLNTSDEMLNIEYGGYTVKIAIKVRRTSDKFLVLLHGIGCSQESFNRAFYAEELQNFSICTFDFPGHGESGSLPSSLYSLQAYADITELVISHLSCDRISILGHSMGGAVGTIAIQGRSDIDCFVNADGNLVAEDCGLVSRNMAAQSSKTFLREGFHQFLAALQNSPRNDFGAWAKWCKSADPHALHQVAKSLVEWSDNGKLLKLFNALKCKAYLYGSQDDKRYLLKQITDTSVSEVPNAGHFMMLDNPDSFYRMLSGALTVNASGRIDQVSVNF